MAQQPGFVGLVIDKNTGAPKFDDPDNAPEAMKAFLTDEHLSKMDADTVRRLGLDNAEYKANVRAKFKFND